MTTYVAEHPLYTRPASAVMMKAIVVDKPLVDVPGNLQSFFILPGYLHLFVESMHLAAVGAPVLLLGDYCS